MDSFIEYNAIDQRYGYLISRIDDGIKTELDNLIKRIVTDEKNFSSANGHLIGNISQQYMITDELSNQFNEFVLQQVNEFNVHNKRKLIDIEYCILNRDSSFFVDDVWINFQSKNEFNPLHFHTGIYSFVIWHTIPYTIAEEDSYQESRSIARFKNHSGKFHFVYNSISTVSIKEIPADKSWEGRIMIFPAKLQHMVYPFYSSNQHRISISGNVKIKI